MRASQQHRRISDSVMMDGIEEDRKEEQTQWELTAEAYQQSLVIPRGIEQQVACPVAGEATVERKKMKKRKAAKAISKPSHGGLKKGY